MTEEIRFKLQNLSHGKRGASRAEMFNDEDLEGFYSVKNEVCTSERVTTIKPKKEGEKNGK